MIEDIGYPDFVTDKNKLDAFYKDVSFVFMSHYFDRSDVANSESNPIQ